MGSLSSGEAVGLHEAVVVSAPGQVHVRPDVPLPPCGAQEVLVQVSYVALNPADQKGIDLSPAVGARLGSDFSGVVVQAGALVDPQRMAVGDCVCGAVPSNDAARPGVGAFGKYVVANQDFVLRVPRHMGLDEAATLPIGTLTCGVALYKEMGLTTPPPPPPPPPMSVPTPQKKGPAGAASSAGSGEWVLVYGASTATGCLAMQLLRLSGYLPLGICSSKNFALVKSRGAAAVYDYCDAERCAAAVRCLTGHRLQYALDCISNSASMSLCYACIGKTGGRYVALDKFSTREHTRRSVRPKWIMANMAFGVDITLGGAYRREADKSFHEFGRQWFRTFQILLLEKGKVQGHPVLLEEGGLHAIAAGLQLLRTGSVSGKKIVYQIGSGRAE